MNENNIKFIQNIINSSLFNIKKLIKYLDEHEIIGEEIFYYICTSDWDKYWGINEKNGFKKINRDVFIKRLPFYTYYDEVNKESINVLFDIFPKKLEESLIERMYLSLEYLYYEEKKSVKEILKYIKKIKTNFILFDSLNNIVDYLKNNNKYNLGFPKYPENFIYYYNLLLEKTNRKPIIYFFDRDIDTGLYHKKHNNLIYFNGYIPIDDSRNPCLQWLSIKCKNVRVYSCKVDGNSYGTLILEVNKFSIIKLFLKTVDGLTPQLIYTSPKYIIVDGKKLLAYRQKLEMTRKDVFEITDISQKTLENWEKNDRNPNGSDLLKLMSLYGISNFYSIIDSNAIDSRLDDKIEFGIIE